MWMEDTEIDHTQYFHTSKMSAFTDDATGTEATDLRFP